MHYTWRTVALALAVLMMAGLGSMVRAQQGCPSCGVPCLPDPGCTHCPGWYHHTQEGHPRICYKCGCPKPICDPCDLPHYGYFQPCWRPWPYGPDWSHCPEMPPAALVYPAPMIPTTTAVEPGGSESYLPPGGPKKSPEELPLPIPGKTSTPAQLKF
jgi:hypothetical protein